MMTFAYWSTYILVYGSKAISVDLVWGGTKFWKGLPFSTQHKLYVLYLYVELWKSVKFQISGRGESSEFIYRFLIQQECANICFVVGNLRFSVKN